MQLEPAGIRWEHSYGQSVPGMGEQPRQLGWRRAPAFWCKEMAVHFYHCSPVSHNLKEGHCCQDFAAATIILPCATLALHLLSSGSSCDKQSPLSSQNGDDWFPLCFSSQHQDPCSHAEPLRGTLVVNTWPPATKFSIDLMRQWQAKYQPVLN